MKITARASGNCTILDLYGQLVVGADTRELRDAVREAAGNHPQKIVLNLAKVTYVDSCGIGELVCSFSHVGKLGGKLVLMHLPKRVKTLLAIAKLAPIFEIFDSEQAAIADSQKLKNTFTGNGVNTPYELMIPPGL